MSGRWRNAELAWQPLYGVQIEESTGSCRSLNPARHGLTVSGTRCFENPDSQKKLSNSALDFSAEDDGPKARAEPSQTPAPPFGAQPPLNHRLVEPNKSARQITKSESETRLELCKWIEEERLNLLLTGNASGCCCLENIRRTSRSIWASGTKNVPFASASGALVLIGFIFHDKQEPSGLWRLAGLFLDKENSLASGGPFRRSRKPSGVWQAFSSIKPR